MTTTQAIILAAGCLAILAVVVVLLLACAGDVLDRGERNAADKLVGVDDLPGAAYDTDGGVRLDGGRAVGIWPQVDDRAAQPGPQDDQLLGEYPAWMRRLDRQRAETGRTGDGYREPGWPL